MDIALVQQRAVPVVGAALEDFLFQVDQGNFALFRQCAQCFVVILRALRLTDVRRNGGHNRNDAALQHRLDGFGHVGSIGCHAAPRRGVVGAEHEDDHAWFVGVEQLGEGRHFLFAAGEHFIGADAAAGGVRSAAVGMIETRQPPAVTVVVGARVHPFEDGLVLFALALAGARPLAVRVRVGDRIADV